MYTLQNKAAFFLTTCVLTAAFLFAVPGVQAETPMLTISTPDSSPSVGTRISIPIFVDPQGETIAGFEGVIRYDTNYVRLRTVNTANSFITIWAEHPTKETAGEVRFSGITPGGFKGVLRPFDSTLHPGKLFTLEFVVTDAGQAVLSAEQLRYVLHSSEGTDATLAPVETAFNTKTRSLDSEKDEDEPPVLDTNAPAAFAPVIARDDDVFNGAWFAVFNTQDAESGISHFEVAERRGAPITDYTRLKWRRAESPYILSDQSRGSTVYIKAVDNSGNTTVEALSPQYRHPWYFSVLLWAILGILLIIGGIVVRKRVRRIHPRMYE